MPRDDDQEVDEAIATIKQGSTGEIPTMEGVGGAGGRGGAGGPGGSDGTGGAGGSGGTGGSGGSISDAWRISKVMAFIIGGVFLGQSIALIATVISITNRDHADQTEEDRDDCFDVYTSKIAETSQHTRAFAALMNAGIARGLLSFGEDPPPGAVLDREELLTLIDDTEVAARADEAANNARTEWIRSGSPLPCPVALRDAVEQSAFRSRSWD